MENDISDQNVITKNLKEAKNDDFSGSLFIPQAPPTTLFKRVKSIGIFSMIMLWAPFLFFVYIGNELIKSGAGGPARFYSTYGNYLLFFEFALAVISAVTIYNSKKYITAIAPLLLLIVGFIAFIFFDILA